MSGYVKAFKKGSPNGWVPAIGDEVFALAQPTRRNVGAIVRKGHVVAVAGKFFKVRLFVADRSYKHGRPAGKSDFELHELRPGPKPYKRGRELAPIRTISGED